MTTEPYTLTQKDIDDMRQVIEKIERVERLTGEYEVGSVNGYMGSAQGTVKFTKRPGALATAEAIDLMFNALPTLFLVCRKVVADWETNPRG